MSTPGYLSNSALAAEISKAVNRWNTNANQITALLSQPSGTVMVSDGLGHNHELPSFPQLQLNVTALTDALTGAVAQVTDISSTVTGLASAAEASASSAQAAAASVEGIVLDVGTAVTAAGEATTAMQAAQAFATDAAGFAGSASSAATSAAAFASTAATARSGAEAACDAAQDYVNQAHDIVTHAGNVVSVAGRTGVVVLGAEDIASGTFDVERIPTLAITAINGLQTALEGKLSSTYVPAWGDVTDKPATFPAAAHTHDAADISGLHTLSAPKRTQRFFFNQL